MSTSQKLDFGMFVMPIHDPEKPLAQCYDEDVELALRCEEMGFSDFWVGEHHSSTYENIVMPEIFLAKVLGMTKHLRIGPAPVCLQYHHPVHVASRLAFLDHLSHGRLNVCFGPGAIPTDMEVYGVDPKDTGPRVAEAIEMILKVWSSDPPYEISGNFWDVQLSKTIDLEMGLGGLHKPLQQPFPPIYCPCITKGSVGARKAAARGFRPISHHMVGEEVLADHRTTFEEGAAEGDRPAELSSWCVSRNIFVAETDAEAEQLARSNSLGRCIEYILELTRRGPGLGMWKRNAEMTDDECNLDYFMNEIVIAGSPETVTAKIRSLRERLGDFGTLVLVAHDWDDKQQWVRNLELFGSEVIPALNA